MPIERLKPTFSLDEERLRTLEQVVPEAFADGRVNWEVLRDLLGERVEDDEARTEHFGLFWPGKREARRLAAQPSKGTLMPLPGEGVDEETTENIFIEGDNLEVLKLLQKSYSGRVKMIYIDPPYNTGNDFIYKDNFAEPLEDYLKKSGQMGEEGELLTTNPKSDGRFHSNWLNMMYPRLRLARNLLGENGVIFMSIGEEEVANLNKLANDIFGEENFISIISRVAKTASDKGTFFAPSIDFVLCYAKNKTALEPFVDDVDESLYRKIEVTGARKGEKYRDDIALYQSSLDTRPNQKYFITCPDGSKVIPPCSVLPPDEVARPGDGVWRWSKATCLQNKDLLVFKATKTSPLLDEKGNKANWNIYTKSYLNDRKEKGTRPRNYLEKFINRKGADLLKTFGIEFPYSKPVELVAYLLKIINADEKAIILDFFAGSCTTAHAVWELNKAGNLNRRFICIQLPEPLDDTTKLHNKGVETVSDVGKERLRRVGKRIKEEVANKLKLDNQDHDYGFKLFKLGNSNFQAWQDYRGDDVQQLEILFANHESPFVEGWKEQEVLTEILLIEGFPLNSKITTDDTFTANRIVQVESDFSAHRLFICLEPRINDKTIERVAELPREDIFICLDSALTDAAKVRLTDVGNVRTV